MYIATLEKTEIALIVDCLAAAFNPYFVPITSDIEYWKQRLYNANYSAELSLGMFDGEQLIGFILHCISDQDPTMAYNTGTGVLANYRGLQITTQLYQKAYILLKNHGIKTCQLEVITENHKAIHIYQKLGFTISRSLISSRGNIEKSFFNDHTHFQSIPIEALPLALINDQHYSWDHKLNVIARNPLLYQCFILLNEHNTVQGYVILQTSSGSIMQIESSDDKEQYYIQLIQHCSTIHQQLRCINIDKSRTHLINAFTSLGFEPIIAQYEMHCSLNDD
jgi:ribosomal protein S18 acetylase RimI-like enzyme